MTEKQKLFQVISDELNLRKEEPLASLYNLFSDLSDLTTKEIENDLNFLLLDSNYNIINLIVKYKINKPNKKYNEYRVKKIKDSWTKKLEDTLIKKDTLKYPIESIEYNKIEITHHPIESINKSNNSKKDLNHKIENFPNKLKQSLNPIHINNIHLHEIVIITLKNGRVFRTHRPHLDYKDSNLMYWGDGREYIKGKLMGEGKKYVNIEEILLLESEQTREEFKNHESLVSFIIYVILFFIVAIAIGRLH